MEKATPQVFISYSHDSDEHAEKVLKLADFLRRKAGIDTNIDQYILNPEGGWHYWMYTEIRNADFVLLVCTKRYCNRFDRNAPKGEGKGVKFESYLTLSQLYENDMLNEKYIPIYFEPKDEDFIPDLLKSYKRYFIDINQPDLWRDEGFVNLYRRVLNLGKIAKPELGPVRDLAGARNIVRCILVLFEGREDSWCRGIREEVAAIQANLDRYFGGIKVKLISEAVFSGSDIQGALFLHEPDIIHFVRNCKGDLASLQKIDQEQFHLLPGVENIRSIFSSYKKKVKGIIIDEEWTPKQLLAALGIVPYVICIGCEPGLEFRIDFLTRLYKNFYHMDHLGKAVLQYSKEGGVLQPEKKAALPEISTVIGGKLRRFRGLEQLKQLEKELEKELEVTEREMKAVQKIIESQDQDWNDDRELLLKDNPFEDIANWFEENMDYHVNLVIQELQINAAPSETESFRVVLGILLELVYDCLLAGSVSSASEEKIKETFDTYDFPIPVARFSSALGFVGNEIQKRGFDARSKRLIEKAFHTLRENFLLAFG